MVGSKSTVLRCTDVSFCYSEDRKENPEVDRVSFDIRTGEIVFLLGRNGSGKTTLLRIIAHELVPDSGRVRLHLVGRTPRSNHAQRRDSELVTWVPQDADDAVASEMTISELVSLTDVNLFRSLAEKCGAEWLYLTSRTHKALSLVKELSGGQRQLLVGLLALAFDRPLILLDEVLRPMDDATSLLYWRLLEMHIYGHDTKAAIVVTHDTSFVSLHARRILGLRDGRLECDFKPDPVNDPEEYSRRIRRIYELERAP